MPIALSLAQAEDFLREHGHDARNLVALHGGLWSAAFSFAEDGRAYVIRFHERRDDLEKDRFAQRWTSASVRTPRVVETGDLPEGGYGISEYVAGDPIDRLDEPAMRRVIPALFSTLDGLRAGDLSGTRGYGLWHGDGNAAHASWRDNLIREDPPGERALQRERLARTHIGHAEFDAGLARIRELLRFCTDERYVVHNDLLNFNVLADGRGIVLLDWGASIYGDFLYDVALLTFWWPWYRERWGGIDVRGAVERHYASIGFTVPHFAERLRCCELDIGVSHIPFQAGREQWDNARWTARRTMELVAAPLSPP